MNAAKSETPALHPQRGASVENRKSKILWLVIPTLIFSAAIWIDLTPYLRGPDEWRWTLRSIQSPERLLVPIIVLGLYVFISARWLNRSTFSAKKFLLFITVAAAIIQFALAFAVSRYPLLEFFGPTVSVHNSGYFTTAIANNDLNNLLSNYPLQMPSLPIHAQSHPPGPIVMQWLGWKFFQSNPSLADSIAMPLRTLQCHNPGLMSLDNSQIASVLLGMLIPLIGALAVWPMYAFGKRIIGSRAALIAAALFPVMPLFAMWPTQWDQIYPLLLFTGLYFMHTGLESKSIWRIFLAGLPLSIATFFSIGNAVLSAVVGMYGVVFYLLSARRRFAFSSSLLLVFTFFIGCASIWISYALIYRVNPIEVIDTGSRLAFESTTGNRSYLLWLLWNPIDFITFLGLPIAVLLLLNLKKILKPARTLLPLVIATFATFILLDLSGIVRGEVGRLWIYFGPLMLLIAGSLLQESKDKEQGARPKLLITNYSLLAGLVALQLITLSTRWLVNDSYLDDPPDRVASFTAPHPSIPTQYSFADQIELTGYAVSINAQTLVATFDWHALSQPIHAYTVFVHVLDRDGKLIGQKDNMPLGDQSITSCWQAGEYVIDPHTLSIDSPAPRPLTIEIGLYVLETGERLLLDDGSGTSVKLLVP